MTLERRFQAGFEEEATNAPGLVIGDDGIVSVVKPSGRRVGVKQSVEYHLSAEVLNAISNDESVDIVAAPGAGHVLIPRYCVGVYRAGSIAYSISSIPDIFIGWEVMEDATGYALFMFRKLRGTDVWGGGPDLGLADQLLIFGGSDAGTLGDFAGNAGGFLLEWFEDQPLSVCWKGDPFQLPGAITDTSLDQDGSGYVPGDTGTVNGSAGVAATYVVDTVNLSSGVETYTLTSAGTEYTPGAHSTTAGGAQPGVGASFRISVDSTDESGSLGDGTLDLFLEYDNLDISALA